MTGLSEETVSLRTSAAACDGRRATEAAALEGGEAGGGEGEEGVDGGEDEEACLMGALQLEHPHGFDPKRDQFPPWLFGHPKGLYVLAATEVYALASARTSWPNRPHNAGDAALKQSDPIGSSKPAQMQMPRLPWPPLSPAGVGALWLLWHALAAGFVHDTGALPWIHHGDVKQQSLPCPSVSVIQLASGIRIADLHICSAWTRPRMLCHLKP